ncbi:MAG TPA: 6-carboxytetrahydropterin synthase [Thermoanaerobaculia bacterium]|jgi:6-pyruvoyltetrahydropterin/6-carboxytetrahydropterin synthase|nr:6-carboxytetrahydropterin synthase [Thermoanaerobaculia bacterium]
MSRYRIALAKEDFKFSAAHFTLFAGGGAELLHGHNYRVEVELGGAGLDEEGLLVDLDSFKKLLRSRCARLDSVTLLPAESRRLQWSRVEGAVEVRCGARVYRFPESDVLLLPLINTSIELLARLLWQELAPHLAGSQVDWMAVSVQESAGQRCWYEDRI